MSKKVRSFRGIATAYNVLCADGRTIGQGAFAHQDGAKVPLVYQHNHKDASQVLGHAILHADTDVVYADCYFNETTQGKNAAELVKHGDINALSIFANKLQYTAGNIVSHGEIKEVSLVLSGANKGAVILNDTITHGDGSYDEDDEACIIHSGYTNEDMGDGWDQGLDGIVQHEESSKTVQDIYDEMTDEQKVAVGYMISAAAGETEELKQSDLKGGNEMKHGNLFDKGNNTQDTGVLSHADCDAIFESFAQTGSLKHSISQFAKANTDKAKAFTQLSHAGGATYGIENIDYLYPDHKNLHTEPDFISRSMEWVNGVISGTHKVPFSRFKMVHADITADEARARGYIKGNQKVEEVFPLLRREVTATWIYKKQKMDQEDIIEVTDFNIVNWLWGEMNVMIREEIARAILIGDGRAALVGGNPNPDKIDETKLIPAAKDIDLYNMKIVVPKNADRSAYLTNVMEAVALKKKDYKGTGSPTFYCAKGLPDEIRIKVKDGIGHYMYSTNQMIASMMGCSSITEVDGFDCQYVTGAANAPEGMAPNKKYKLLGLAINLRDYTVGTNRGGQLTKFSDFDIDRNQHKYLIETYLSGAINKPMAAITLWEEIA